MKLVATLGFLLSVLIAGLAVIFLRPLLEQQPPSEVKQKPKTVVVATDPLKYGERLTQNKLKIVEWYAESVPQGSVGTIEELAITEDGPYVLTSIPLGSPILKNQLTSPGQKPSLSALLDPGTVAVTVPVTTITGVAGFVLPDERVDIYATQTKDGKKFNQVILQDIKVLAADRVIEADPGKPVVAKSVTFQVPRQDAQKLILATQEGEVFLTLRSTDKSADDALGSQLGKVFPALPQDKSEEKPEKAKDSFAQIAKEFPIVAPKPPTPTDTFAKVEQEFSNPDNVRLLTFFKSIKDSQSETTSGGSTDLKALYFRCNATRCIDSEGPKASLVEK